MPRASTGAWEKHTTEVSREEEKNGIVVTVKGWACNYCGGEFFNRSAKRLLGHICCDKALCPHGITTCSTSKVPPEVSLKYSYKWSTFFFII